jgi:hypothetical protein
VEKFVSLLIQCPLESLVNSRYGVTEIDGNPALRIFCGLVDLFEAAVLQQRRDQLEVVVEHSVVHRRELQLATWLIEVEQRTLGFVLLSGQLVVTEGEPGRFVLAVLERLVQGRVHIPVLAVDVAPVLDEDPRYFPGLLHVLAENLHDDVERRVAFLVDLVEVLLGTDALSPPVALQNPQRIHEVLVVEGHVESRAVLHGLLLNAGLVVFEKDLGDLDFVVLQRKDYGGGEVHVDGVEELVESRQPILVNHGWHVIVKPTRGYIL